MPRYLYIVTTLLRNPLIDIFSYLVVIMKGKLFGLSVYDFFGVLVVNSVDAVDFAVVGDSLGMVFKGCRDVKCVSLNDIVYHASVVLEHCRKPVYVDVPYEAYAKDIYQGIERILVLEPYGLLVEGVLKDVWRWLEGEGIRYIAHLGYMPKFHDRPRVVRMDDGEWLIDAALEAESRGAEMVKLELVESSLAKLVAEKLDIPVLGVGAGPYVDGQILVLYDFLGMYPGFEARFVRRYVDLYQLALEAVEKLAKDIKMGRYPTADESY